MPLNVLSVLVPLLVAALLWIAVAYNRLVRPRNQFRNAWAQIEVQLKRRHDLVPNLVEVVKGYMSYEQETLDKVIRARGMAMSSQGTAAMAKAEGMLTEALKSLFALVENYPDLKANQNVAALQEELASTENRIGFARQFYNDAVMSYTNATQSFPSNLVASLFGFAAAEFFVVPEEEKAVPKVSLR